jgi:hypothetical protein
MAGTAVGGIVGRGGCAPGFPAGAGASGGLVSAAGFVIQERLAIMIDLKETAGATTPLARTAPAAFPREGAKNVLDNDRVRMWDMTWPADRPAAPLQYAPDAVEVVVTGGTFTVRGADGRDTTRVVAARDARFIARGSIESVRATAGTPRTITVEIK